MPQARSLDPFYPIADYYGVGPQYNDFNRSVNNGLRAVGGARDGAVQAVQDGVNSARDTGAQALRGLADNLQATPGQFSQVPEPAGASGGVQGGGASAPPWNNSPDPVQSQETTPDTPPADAPEDNP